MKRFLFLINQTVIRNSIILFRERFILLRKRGDFRQIISHTAMKAFFSIT